MTKLEAEVMKIALRFWRASNGMNADSPDEPCVRPEEVEASKNALLEAVGRAAPFIKDWVIVAQSPDPNIGFIRCAGCSVEDKVQGPFTMERFASVYQAFRAKHINCGPVGEDPA